MRITSGDKIDIFFNKTYLSNMVSYLAEKLINYLLGLEYYNALTPIKIPAKIDSSCDYASIPLCTDVINIIRDYAKIDFLWALQSIKPFLNETIWISIAIDDFKLSGHWRLCGINGYERIFDIEIDDNIEYQLRICCEHHSSTKHQSPYVLVFDPPTWKYIKKERYIRCDLVQCIGNMQKLWFNPLTARNCRAFTKACKKYQKYECIDVKSDANVQINIIALQADE